MRKRTRPLRRRGAPDNHRSGVSLAFRLSLAALLACNAASASAAPAVQASIPGDVDFKMESASPQVRHVAQWVITSGDNHGMPYLIVDKINARVFMFDTGGHIKGDAAALLGMAKGDRSVAGIGDRKMSGIRPQDRITPAGRFLASLDHDIHGKEILLIDYAASIALHPVVKGTPQERRAARLQSTTSDDNRISFGCINVPAKFYATVVSPAFTHTSGLVYILSETGKASETSGLYDATVETPKLASP
jgi:hypothetical protein